MKKQRFANLFAVILICSMALSACAAPAPVATTAPAAPAATTAPAAPAATTAPAAPAAPAATTAPAAAASGTCSHKIGYVSDVGKINDQSFNQASWEGVQAGAKSLGLSQDCFSFIETKDSADYATNIDTFAKEGYDIIVTSGFAMGAATRAEGVLYPNVTFIGVDQTQVDANFKPAPMKNVIGINFHEDVGGFLAGALAGLMTKSNVVAGVFACQTIPAVARYEVGFHNGVTYTNPKAKIIDVYYPGSIDQCFSDSNYGAETAKTLVGQGADVLYGAGGLTANGALISACNQKAYVIGTDMDQFLTLPEVKNCILSSALKDVTIGIQNQIVAVDKKTFTGGDIYGSSSLAPFHNLDSAVPADAQAKLKDINAKLLSGEINPCTPFTGSNPNTFCVPIK
ncbi:MAG: BMP family ABC transporter substrate-binding protein [Anaerolineaceae bacterium]|nr:BMP family ABC transporter substrate-binding protein [Anaerolineaceae bacterium]